MSADTAPREWDAATYDRVSSPQVAWAAGVLDRLALDGGETVLDAGCGSGRVTRLLLERLPRGRVVAVDSSEAMVATAAAALDDRATVFRSDLAELRLDEPVDAVFSNAVFHWVPDHPRLFARLFDALVPGGRLVAQCGGEGNIAGFHAIAAAVGEREPFSEALAGWRGPWRFAGAEDTANLLDEAGFEGITCWLEPWPVSPDEPLAFVETVCLGHHLGRLAPDQRRPFAQGVLEAAPDPLLLDYVRLNIDARRPA